MSAVILALSLLLPAQQAAPATPDLTERLVVLPVRVSAEAPVDLKRAGEALERVLTEALSRHASQRVVSRQEVAALMGEAMRQQLMGCDAESCLLEAADALGAQFAVASVLSRLEDTWVFQATLLRRQDATAMRRASVRVRSLDALLNSMEPVARQLAGGDLVVVEDPKLAHRLATTDEGAQTLREAVKARPGQDVAEVWTRIIVERNRESGILPLMQGIILGGAGTLGVLLAGAAAAGLGFYSAGVGARDLKQVPYSAIGGLVMLMGSAAGVVLVVLTAVPAVAALAALDWVNVGRLAVGRDGCCRDEDALEEAASPGPGQRAGAILGALGGVLAAVTPIGGAAAYLAGLILGGGGFFPLTSGPAVTVPDSAGGLVLWSFSVGLGVAALAGVLPTVLIGVALLTVALLVLGEHAPVTDDDAP